MARITGTRYSDDIDGTDSSDTIEGFGGDDRIWGHGGNDLIYGDSGHDELDGGTGADRMEGGTGDDLYVVDSTGDQAIEYAGEGIDVLLTHLATYALGAHIEDLVALSTADFRATGNSLDNYIYGYTGNDIIDGGEGDDVMYGERGNDTFFVDDAGDEVIELADQGYDTIFTSLASLVLDPHVEALIFDGAGSFVGVGNGRDNYIEGGAGNDRLEGRAGDDLLVGAAGADRMIGGTGNDNYRIDNVGDRVVEFSGEGSDRIATSVSYALSGGASVETLGTSNAASTAAINLTGNELAQSIYGNAGANQLSGGGGRDSLVGLGGNDRLDGGTGSDNLRGGAGNDVFRFTAPLDGANNVDRILDFSVADDTIHLDDAVFSGLARGPLPANAFRTGSAAADADDRIIYNPANGALLFDADGNGGGAAVQFALLQPSLALTANDFVVI